MSVEALLCIPKNLLASLDGAGRDIDGGVLFAEASVYSDGNCRRTLPASLRTPSTLLRLNEAGAKPFWRNDREPSSTSLLADFNIFGLPRAAAKQVSPSITGAPSNLDQMLLLFAEVGI